MRRTFTQIFIHPPPFKDSRPDTLAFMLSTLSTNFQQRRSEPTTHSLSPHLTRFASTRNLLIPAPTPSHPQTRVTENYKISPPIDTTTYPPTYSKCPFQCCNLVLTTLMSSQPSTNRIVSGRGMYAARWRRRRVFHQNPHVRYRT